MVCRLLYDSGLDRYHKPNILSLDWNSKYLEGQILQIDKPLEWTSFDVVKKLRYALKVKKIGHAGTLDPLATGLLLIGTGKATKQLQALQGLDKTYEGIIEIGKTTPSYDLETPFDTDLDWGHISEEDILEVVTKFLGAIEQYPPAHSAVKIGGERAYKKARRNEQVELKVRKVTIQKFNVVKIDLPEIHFEVGCSKGTYIRSLAHDFGQALGVGGYLKSLRRTSIGDFHVNEALTLDDFLKTLSLDEGN